MNYMREYKKVNAGGIKLVLMSLVLIMSLALIGSSLAVELPLAKPEEVGMSSEILDTIKPAMAKMLERKRAPGVVTLVARKGKVVHFEAVGSRYVEEGLPMEKDTIFRIMSMTKPIVSVALMMLYENGHFQLDDPIKKWLPEFSNPVVAVERVADKNGKKVLKTEPAKRPITFRHVLTHTAGLSNRYRGKLTKAAYQRASQRKGKNDTIGDFVKRYAAVPLNYHPGEEWQYSRATCVAGRLVEVISGMALDEFLREKMFKPLRMVDTYFYLPVEKLERFAATYRPGPDKRKIVLAGLPNKESRWVKEPQIYFSGSGGLLSTAADYFRFCQMMLNGGELDGARVLKPDSIALMTQNHTGDLSLWLAPGAQFGLGFALTTADSQTYGSKGTYSWGGAHYTKFFIDPVKEIIVILLSQVAPNRHLKMHYKFQKIAIKALMN